MTRKRDTNGKRRTQKRAAEDLVTVHKPDWRIVSDAEWSAAHERLAIIRDVYLRRTDGRPFGRPLLGDPLKYLLTTLALCGCGGAPLKARTRPGRRFYGCSSYHDRGPAISRNNADVPMVRADAELIEALVEDVLDPSMLRDAVDATIELLAGHHP